MDSFIVSGRSMKRAVIIACWICVIVTGVFLRFEDLASRPFHADEATGARITARRMEEGGSQFDPKHYHGPLLADLAIPLCRMHGESGWRTMTKSTLRTLPALAGSLLLLVPLLWRRRCGDVPMLLASAFLATSPLLVYYSRMFIHESLLALFGMLVLFSFALRPRPALTGFLIGLMFATKETFAISLIAWSGAGILLLLENRRSLDRAALSEAWRRWRFPFVICAATAMLVSFAIYTDGFRHPEVAKDAVRTFFVYETVGGHDKPAPYYLKLLAWPLKSGGTWWFGTPLVLLALFAYLSTFRRDDDMRKHRNLIRFTAYAAAGHFVIYSLIAYKTPWLACLPWAHVALLAGFAFIGLCRRPLALGVPVIALTVFCIATQIRQTRLATGRFASDERNPFAYVPTRKDVETLEPWLARLAKVAPDGTLEPVAVVGSDYWPLPWYLRAFERKGYWAVPPPEGLDAMPLVFAMPETADAVAKTLEASHVLVPRGLRAGVPLTLFVRKDVWRKWMETDKR